MTTCRILMHTRHLSQKRLTPHQNTLAVAQAHRRDIIGEKITSEMHARKRKNVQLF